MVRVISLEKAQQHGETPDAKFTIEDTGTACASSGWTGPNKTGGTSPGGSPPGRRVRRSTGPICGPPGRGGGGDAGPGPQVRSRHVGPAPVGAEAISRILAEYPDDGDGKAAEVRGRGVKRTRFGRAGPSGGHRARTDGRVHEAGRDRGQVRRPAEC